MLCHKDRDKENDSETLMKRETSFEESRINNHTLFKDHFDKIKIQEMEILNYTSV